MKNHPTNKEEEQRLLVLARFKTLDPESKILLGGNDEVTVRELVKHIERGDKFGEEVVRTQIEMLKILSNVT